MSKLTDNTLLPGKTAKLTASGAIVAGKPVILNSDGTVTQVTETAYSKAIPSGTESRGNGSTEANMNIDIDVDPNTGKVAMVFIDVDSPKYGFIVIGTVSGTTITWGTPSAFKSQEMYSYSMGVRFDPNTANSFVITYMHNHSTYAQKQVVVAGTVSGTSVTLGSELNFQAGHNTNTSLYNNIIAWDPNTAGRFVYIYNKESGSGHSSLILCTVSSSRAITAGSEKVYANSTGNLAGWPYSSVIWNPNVANELLVTYQGSGVAKCRVGTVGTTGDHTDGITYGTETTVASNYAYYFNAAFDTKTSNSFVMCMSNASSGNGEALAGTLVGSTFTFGTKVTIPQGGSGSGFDVKFDPSVAGKLVCIYYSHDGSNYRARVNEGSISGTTLSWNSTADVLTTEPLDGNANATSLAFMPVGTSPGKFIAAYKMTSSATNANAIGTKVCQRASTTTNMTATNMIGIADQAIANTASGDISLKGGLATGGLSGLTPGTDYYAQGNATINTTTTSPAVKLGKALSSTAINLEYRS